MTAKLSIALGAFVTAICISFIPKQEHRFVAWGLVGAFILIGLIVSSNTDDN
jgi:predicted tellurium resistance membrane protein TerC